VRMSPGRRIWRLASARTAAATSSGTRRSVPRIAKASSAGAVVPGSCKFQRAFQFGGRYTVVVSATTDVDHRFAGRVASLAGTNFSGRMAKELREYGVLHAVGYPGRGLTVDYNEDDVRVAASIERAKANDFYKRKLRRAVLIAYLNGAPIADKGLRRAWSEELRSQEERALMVANGGRVHPDERLADHTVDELRNLAGMLTGTPVRDIDPVPGAVRAVGGAAASNVRLLLSTIGSSLHQTDPSAFRELQASTQTKEHVLADPRLGLVEDGVKVTPVARTLGESLRFSLLVRVVLEAPRDRLDRARDLLGGILHQGLEELTLTDLIGTIPAFLLGQDSQDVFR
jgi:hypothetical protein